MGALTRQRRRAAVAILLTVALSLVVVGAVSAAPAAREASLSGNDVEGGDPNASGRAVLRVAPVDGTICFRITYRRMIAPTYGSIHSGSKEFGGPLEVTLFNGDKGGRSSPIRGCVRDLSEDLLRDIKQHPRRFYVDINQHVYANSVIRGRIHKPN